MGEKHCEQAEYDRGDEYIRDRRENVGEWIGIDPTWDQPLIDATHIKLCDGDVDSRILELMGSVKIDILEAK